MFTPSNCKDIVINKFDKNQFFTPVLRKEGESLFTFIELHLVLLHE